MHEIGPGWLESAAPLPSVRERLYFLHIPKTGGTTLRVWLESHFAREEVLPPEDPSQFLARCGALGERWRFASGHYGMFFPRRVTFPMRIIAVLRDPMSRSISHYLDIRSRPRHALYAEVRRMTFEHFVMSDLGDLELRNLQCRYLALEDLDADFHAHRREGPEDPDQLRAKYADPAMLAKAEAALGSCEFVGVCEGLGALAGEIASRLGWRPPAAMPRLNGSRETLGPGSLTAAAVERVRALTDLDERLYRRAVERCAAGGMPTHIAS